MKWTGTYNPQRDDSVAAAHAALLYPCHVPFDVSFSNVE